METDQPSRSELTDMFKTLCDLININHPDYGDEVYKTSYRAWPVLTSKKENLLLSKANDLNNIWDKVLAVHNVTELR